MKENFPNFGEGNRHASPNYTNKLNKQEEQRQNHGYKECFVGGQMGVGRGGMGEEVRGLRSTNR